MNEIEELLKSGADVNTMDKNDFTLLMSFSKKGDEQTVKTLLDYGAKTNIKDFSNFTALDYAIQNKHTNIAKLLVDCGAVITSDNYMLALNGNQKVLVSFFDSLDPDKYIFLKKKKK
jgi:ankyrin repeat protein